MKQKRDKCLRTLCMRGNLVNFHIASSRSSQAALEFLTTYGWALIMITIVIAAIVYFGVFNPKKILPDSCIFKSGFDCHAFSIGSNGTLNLRLKNSLGKPISITGINVSADAASDFSCTAPPVYPFSLSPEESRDLSWSGCNSAQAGFVSDSKRKVFFKIGYYDVRFGPQYAQIAEGETFSTII